jgi:hypothetical protein
MVQSTLAWTKTPWHLVARCNTIRTRLRQLLHSRAMVMAPFVLNALYTKTDRGEGALMDATSLLDGYRAWRR